MFSSLLLWAGLAVFAAEPPEGFVEVLRLSGEITYGKIKVKEHHTLALGDVLDTGKDPKNFVDVEYRGGQVLRFKGKTRAKLGRLDPAKDSVIDLLLGKIYFHFKPHSNSTKLHIKTKAAIAGVRGTQYMIEEVPEKGTYVCVCKGSVSVQATTVTGEQVVIQGEDLWVKPGVPLGKPKVSPEMDAQTKDEFRKMGF